jgi:hypothetical protein
MNTHETQSPTLPILPFEEAPILHKTTTITYAPSPRAVPANNFTVRGAKISPLERAMAFAAFTALAGLLFIPIGIQLGRQSADDLIKTSQQEKAAASQALQQQSAQIEAFCKSVGQ